MKRAALITSGIIFTLVSASHFYRHLTGAEVTMGGINIPTNLSLVVAIVAAVLALWMFIAIKCKK